jgi:hypothetical protein
MTRDQFYRHAVRRLSAGAAEYGDRSFYQSTSRLVQEIEEELADVAVWTSIMMAGTPVATLGSPRAAWEAHALIETALSLSQRLSYHAAEYEALRIVGGHVDGAKKWLRMGTGVINE